MNSKVWIVGLLLVAVVLAACGGAAEEPTEIVAVPTEGANGKVAVILTGPHDDFNWNAAGYAGAMALKDKGYEVKVSEGIADADVERLLRELADEGFDLIDAHSFSYQDPVFLVASEYPDVNFIWSGGIQRTAENVGDFSQPWYQAAYPIGIIAGYMSESGVLGALHGFDIPSCHAQGEAMLAGARTVNPDARLIHSAVGDWLDIAKAKEAALAQADAGVDFWMPCGQGPALGALAAAQEVGGYLSGEIADMTAADPNIVLVNLIHDMEPVLTRAVEDTMNGTFDNPFYDFGVAEGAVYVTYNEDLKSKIPEEALKAAEEALEAIRAGELEVEFVGE